MRVIIASDLHYGLKSAGFDRTPEIHDITKRIVKYIEDRTGIHSFICCGDTCHRANPNSQVHAKLFEIYDRLEKGNVWQSRFIVGNHDANKQKPIGCLAPLKEADFGTVKCVDRIYSEPAECGWNFLYLPFPLGFELTEERFLEEVELCGQYNIAVFSHLAVDGASLKGDFILRGARNSIPKFVLEHPQVKVVFNGHIHIPQTVGKVEIIGAPFQTDFGDTFDKSFLDVVFKEDGTFDISRISTDHDKLVQIDLDLTIYKDPRPVITLPKNVEGSIVKFNIRCREDQLPEIEGIHSKVKMLAKFVRPFVPTVVREGKQTKTVVKAGMTDEEAVRSWVSSKTPMNPEQVLDFALKSLDM